MVLFMVYAIIMFDMFVWSYVYPVPKKEHGDIFDSGWTRYLEVQ